MADRIIKHDKFGLERDGEPLASIHVAYDAATGEVIGVRCEAQTEVSPNGKPVSMGFAFNLDLGSQKLFYSTQPYKQIVALFDAQVAKAEKAAKAEAFDQISQQKPQRKPQIAKATTADLEQLRNLKR